MFWHPNFKHASLIWICDILISNTSFCFRFVTFQFTIVTFLYMCYVEMWARRWVMHVIWWCERGAELRLWCWDMMALRRTRHRANLLWRWVQICVQVWHYDYTAMEQCPFLNSLKECWAIIAVHDLGKRSWRSNELTHEPYRDRPTRSSNIITELRLSDHIILWWSGWSVPWLNLANWTFSMKLKTSMKLPIENFWFPTFGRSPLLLLSRHTYVPRHTGWEALFQAIIF